ncbi:UvrD-helicase domain-containing protein [Streptomyces sp. N2A]|uniref:UvrD-helicase domain-containing protein n=1 Tax=Streptomyces sp. N2A TaxID=3073936 RepID=UPI00286FDD81|nr:UvrD-helicase domain-containing protein [Streptomyces sp. N2A]
MEPTKEQQAARDVFAAGRDLALVAGAGTGKTSTLILMGSATRKRGLYMAFNRAIADDARRRFGRNVECRTAHSLAFRAVGHLYQDRLNASARIPAKHTARLLGIERDVVINSRRIKVPHQARLVMGMVRRFCYTTDRQVTARHLETVNGLDLQGQEYLARTLLPYAEAAWKDICSPTGRLRFEHDHYMKLWAMGEPRLPADFVLLDEAQDTNPVLEEVFLAQHAQRVCVGDPAQQIYAWRHARDVMTGFPAEQLWLTQSFRFGPAIARTANRWLRHADSEMKLTGHGPDSRIGKAPHPDAVLCRGNADAMSEVLAYLEQGIPVALTGGGSALHRIATAAKELKAGQRTSHPELFLFSSWGEVQEYAEQDKAGQDLKAIVHLVDTYGPDLIIQAVDRLSPEEAAQVTVSTAHKAKGREWNNVRIGQGFEAPPVDDDGLQRTLSTSEARLIYVAVTRARHLLDTEGLAWIDTYERTTTDTGGDGTVGGRSMSTLSLTAQLKYATSPLSRFMAAHLPHSHNLVRDYQSRIAGLPYPVQPIDVPYPNWSALGHTIDYRLRLSLGGRLGDAVTLGVMALAAEPAQAPTFPTRRALHVAGKNLLAKIDDHLTARTTLDDASLTRLCFVAAFFEDIARTGEIRRYSMLANASPSTGLENLVTAVPDYVLTDINQQLVLAERAFAPFRALPPAARTCGPVFTGSSDLGGADADFILGGLLLDCKATKNPRSLGRDEIYQLAGYLLLDYDNQYGINRVGLYLSRQGGLVTWEAADFLRRLGADAPLAVLRTRMRHHLREAG